VRRIVTLMNGEITVDSRPGVGTMFRVILELPWCLPPETAPANTGEPMLHTDFARDHPLRILVAEDEAMNTRLINEVLRRLGYLPVMVASGAQALDCIAREKFDVLLLDLQMGETDGCQVARVQRARSEATGTRCPVMIALTAYAMQQDRQRAEAAGFDHFLTKPLQLGLLQQTLRAAWSAKQVAERSAAADQ
jgi:CheY-like chemotaxis protein